MHYDLHYLIIDLKFCAIALSKLLKRKLITFQIRWRLADKRRSRRMLKDFLMDCIVCLTSLRTTKDRERNPGRLFTSWIREREREIERERERERQRERERERERQREKERERKREREREREKRERETERESKFLRKKKKKQANAE